MNGKTILKKTLPVIIALVVIIVIALIVTVASGAKKNPNISNPDQVFVSYTNGDVKVDVTRQDVYDSLVNSSTGLSATVSELVDMIDADLLAQLKNSEGTSFLDAAKESNISERVAKAIFSSTFNDYVKNNEESYKLQAKKEGKTYDAYLEDKVKEAVSSFVDTLQLSYGLQASETDFVYMENGNFITEVVDGETVYKFSVKTTSDTYNYYKLQQAKYDYARVKFEEQYKDELAAYKQYKADLEAYNKYADDYEAWEDAKAAYDSASKEERKNMTNPGKKFNKDSSYWHGEYTVTEKPEEVSEPTFTESDFKNKYEDENYDKYWLVAIPYDSRTAAENALLQHGVVVATNADGDYTWFHYGTLDAAGLSNEEKAELEAKKYTTKGQTKVIIDNEYYKTLDSTTVTSAAPAKTGAYELSEKEIKAMIFSLYSQFYQANSEKALEAADYTLTEGDYTFNKTDKLLYKKSELTSLGLYSANSVNKLHKYDGTDGATNAFRDTYTYSIVSGSSKYYIYLIVGKEVAKTWEDLLSENNDDYTLTETYTNNLSKMLDDKTTTSIIKNKMSALRYDSALLIYDSRVEESYMSAYASDYKATKKTSKTDVVSYEINGDKKVVSCDQLFDKLSKKYGVVSTIDDYQIEWMFLEAKITDKDGNEVLVNKYVDYAGYKDAKKPNISKFRKSDDKEVKDLFDDVETYVENTKNNFAAGAYTNYGYSADYGWTNFIHDYFKTNYGFDVNTTEDLKLFYIYQQIVSDYCEWLAEVNDEVWNNIYLTSMAKTLSEYLNMTGVHFLISVKDSSGSMVDPLYWTADQVAAAKELYDKVLQLVTVLPTSEISTELGNIVTAFNNAPLMVDGAEPNIDYKVKASDDTEYTYKYFDYEYHYYRSFTYTIDVSKYKSLGLSVTNESLTITQGTMVSEFENAVRQIWDKQWVKLLEGETVTDVVVYDHSYKPEEYKSFGADLAAEVASNYTGENGYLATQFGYHVYINLTSSISAYFTKDGNNDNVFIGFPAKDYARLYVYEATQSSKDDYKSLSDLYDSYKGALKDGDETKINSAKEKLLDAAKGVLKKENFDEVYAVLDNYYGDNKTYVASMISKWFGTYSSSSSSTLIFGDFLSSGYYQMSVLKEVLSNVNNFNFDEESKNMFTTSINFYLDSYYSALSYISFIKQDKDAVESLLDSINLLSDYTAYTANLDKLFTAEGHTLEKTTMTNAFNALKAYTKAAYNNLSAEDKALLLEKYTKANLE